jgi:ABC-type phosphate/phosphonate transport system permease subunit
MTAFAAAGLAEAAWAEAACIMLLALGVVGLVTLFALALRSRSLAVMACVLLLLATALFQPWHCFSPFEKAAYSDLDVRSAAGMFRTVGCIWVGTCVAATGSVLLSFLAPKKGPQAARS